MKKAVCLLLFLWVTNVLWAQEFSSEADSLKRRRREARAEQFDSIRSRVKDYIEEIRPDYNADSVRRELDSAPYFSLFRDNYMIGGVPIGDKIMASNSNVKFQLSVLQRVTSSKLPFNTYLFIQFTQKTIWNVVQKSMPMRDINLNPGIGLGHLIIYKNRYIGKGIFMIEHESNGKDGLDSRSWNKVSFGANLLLTNNIEGQMKVWIPIIDSDNNRDILRYNGLGHVGINYRTPDRRFYLGVLATWRTQSFSFNTQTELSFKPNRHANQYIFLQYYNGYGENLFDYNQYKSVLRIGFVIKPQDFSIY
ncbi:MAG: phospholipase A [Tannerella sp.]|jgi:phospholipase A1|nr:phospholipase A [Tannerella sp.]